jgi:hypothetical protein
MNLNLNIHLLSFVFGVVLTLAIVIIVEKVYGKLFGDRKLRKLERENIRLKKVVQKKDELIKRSLKEIQDKEKKNDGHN